MDGSKPFESRGSITVFVLVCLVAITAICGVLLRIGLAERQRIRAEERRLQADWLVESGWSVRSHGSLYQEVNIKEKFGPFPRRSWAVAIPGG